MPRQSIFILIVAELSSRMSRHTTCYSGSKSIGSGNKIAAKTTALQATKNEGNVRAQKSTLRRYRDKFRDLIRILVNDDAKGLDQYNDIKSDRPIGQILQITAHSLFQIIHFMCCTAKAAYLCQTRYTWF